MRGCFDFYRAADADYGPPMPRARYDGHEMTHVWYVVKPRASALFMTEAWLLSSAQTPPMSHALEAA